MNVDDCIRSVPFRNIRHFKNILTEGYATDWMDLDVTIALVGFGGNAQSIYLPIMTRMRGVTLVLCTSNKEVLARLTREYRIGVTTADYKSISGTTREGVIKVDAVMIHTRCGADDQSPKTNSEDSHLGRGNYNMAKWFIDHNIPTFVDMPVALTGGEVEALVFRSRYMGVPFICGFNRRHISLLQKYVPESQLWYEIPNIFQAGSKTSQQLGALEDADQGLLRSIRWEKYQDKRPADIRKFVFTELVHCIDAVSNNMPRSMNDVYVAWKVTGGGLLDRIDLNWQSTEGVMVQVSLNCAFGKNDERILCSYTSEDDVDYSVEFHSFTDGKMYKNGITSSVKAENWGKSNNTNFYQGFVSMIEEWVMVVRLSRGKKEYYEAGEWIYNHIEKSSNRTALSHRLAESVCQKIEKGGADQNEPPLPH